VRDYTKPHLDVFNISVLKGAMFVGPYDIPLLKVSNHVPLDLIAFSRRKHANESHCLISMRTTANSTVCAEPPCATWNCFSAWAV